MSKYYVVLKQIAPAVFKDGYMAQIAQLFIQNFVRAILVWLVTKFLKSVTKASRKILEFPAIIKFRNTVPPDKYMKLVGGKHYLARHISKYSLNIDLKISIKQKSTSRPNMRVSNTLVPM